MCSIIANLMTSAESLRETSAVFKKWDTNGDGFLSPGEIAQHMGEVCSHFGLPASQLHKLIRAADLNKDGKIDYSEFVTATFDKRKLLDISNLRRVFGKLDVNKNGYISKAEIRSILVVGGHN